MNLWTPLHVHSEYSILGAFGSVRQIAKRAADLGFSACALTDHNSLYGLVDFYKECKAHKIKPILGCELAFAFGSRFDKHRCPKTQRPSHHLTLIAKNQQGYLNLCKLSSKAHLEGFYFEPRADLDLLKKHAEGLICLTGCSKSQFHFFAAHQMEVELKEWLRTLFEIFSEDLYIEVMRHHMSEEALREGGFYKEPWRFKMYQDFIRKQKEAEEAAKRFSLEFSIKCVATNNSHYIYEKDYQAHEVLINIQSGEPCKVTGKDGVGGFEEKTTNPKRRVYPVYNLWFKSQNEMEEAFFDWKEPLFNTQEIVKKCSLELDFATKHYPVYYPEGIKEKKLSSEEREKVAVNKLWSLCREGILKRYQGDRLDVLRQKYPDKDPFVVIEERLEYEMGVIVPKGMCDYLLIVWDFLNWAKQNRIPVGPGRGSGAGSIVLYLIGITDIEPLRFDLFFERFINPERISYPDIDVDICMERRQEVIDYAVKKYGKDNVAQIITFGTMKAKMVLKDVARVFSVPLSKVNKVAKYIPDDLSITLDKALEIDPDFSRIYHEDLEMREVIDVGRRLEGTIRSTGIHAAGVVIAGEDLTNYIPVTSSKDGEIPATQFSMKPVESVGMLKMDLLGLKTLTSIQACVEGLRLKGIEIDWINLPLDDENTFALLNQGKTFGVFQLESQGMQELAKQLHLDCFEEIIAVTSLYRPGPMDMIPSFINRKHGREKIESDHPWMDEILKETYGIMVYQEQVMQIAQKLAGYTLGEGDILRRAMGKKDAEQMKTQREKFVEGALKNGIDEKIAESIFDKMEKFAAYGFNKSHAAAYSYLAYVTAFLKANYPAEWMAAMMTSDRHDISKISKTMEECRFSGIPVLSPDINESFYYFHATDKGVRFALSAIKGFGEAGAEVLLEERKKGGAFLNIENFLERVNTHSVGKKQTQLLIEAGAFDCMGWKRDSLILFLEEHFDHWHRFHKEKSQGVLSLFAKIPVSHEKKIDPPLVKIPTPLEKVFLKEKELLGFFFTGHPLDLYEKEVEALDCHSLSKFPFMEDGFVFKSVFLLEEVETKISQKSQRKYAHLKISDKKGSYTITLWPQIYQDYASILEPNTIFIGIFEVEKEDEVVKVSCKWLVDYSSPEKLSKIDLEREFASVSSKNKYRSKKGAKIVQQVQKNMELPQDVKKIIKIKAAAETISLKTLYDLKVCLLAHPGNCLVEIIFYSETIPAARVVLDESFSVAVTSVFIEELKKLELFLE